MYAPALCCNACANCAIVVFLHAVITLMFAAGFGAFGTGLHSDRSDSSAFLIVGLLFATVSAYTVTSRFSMCVFSSNCATNSPRNISSPTLKGGGSGLPFTICGAPSPVLGTFASIIHACVSADLGSPTTISLATFCG